MAPNKCFHYNHYHYQLHFFVFVSYLCFICFDTVFSRRFFSFVSGLVSCALLLKKQRCNYCVMLFEKSDISMKLFKSPKHISKVNKISKSGHF